MKLSLAAKYDFDLVPKLRPYPVADAYGKFAADLAGGGRPSYMGTALTKKDLADYITLESFSIHRDFATLRAIRAAVDCELHYYTTEYVDHTRYDVLGILDDGSSSCTTTLRRRIASTSGRNPSHEPSPIGLTSWVRTLSLSAWINSIRRT